MSHSGEYPYTFDGGSGVFEVVPNKLQLTTNVNRDDLKQKRMMSSKHIIDRTPYNDKYDHIIHNKRAVFIQVDNNFSFHGIGDFANYYKAKTIIFRKYSYATEYRHIVCICRML